MNRAQFGPCPVVLGVDREEPDERLIVQLADGRIERMTRDELVAIPMREQWWSGVNTGLIASWPDADTAIAHARGNWVGRLVPTRVGDLERFGPKEMIVVVGDVHGAPWRGEASEVSAP